MTYRVRVHGGSKHSFDHNTRKHDASVEYGEHTHDMEVWFDRSNEIEEVYQELFGEAIEKYNEKQGSKHKERQTSVEEYLDKQRHTLVKGSQKGEYEEDNQECFELILSVGSIEDQPNRETQKKILKEFYDGWEEKYPNLKLVQVAYHGDERGVPHLHIDFIPIAHKDKGLGVQVEWKGAAKEMGIEWNEMQTYTNAKGEEKSKKVGGKEVIHSMIRSDYISLCRSHGLEIESEAKADREELEVWEYKRKQEKSHIAEIQQVIKSAEKSIQFAQELNENLAPMKNDVVELSKPTMDIPKLPSKTIGTFTKEEVYNAKDVLEHLNKAKDVYGENIKLQHSNDTLRAQNSELQAINRKALNVDAIKENESLRAENEKLKGEVNELHKTIDNIKEQLHQLNQFFDNAMSFLRQHSMVQVFSRYFYPTGGSTTDTHLRVWTEANNEADRHAYSMYNENTNTQVHD